MVTGLLRGPQGCAVYGSSYSDLFILGVSFVVCLGVGALSGMAGTSRVVDWYPTLKKPSLSPPPWVFGPVWISLYLLMAAALFLVARQGLAHPGVPFAIALFALQLLLNALWSLIFFGRKALLAALVDLALLWVAIAATLVAFWPLSPLAAALLVPYLIWVSFAGYLNLAIWRLNP